MLTIFGIFVAIVIQYIFLNHILSSWVLLNGIRLNPSCNGEINCVKDLEKNGLPLAAN